MTGRYFQALFLIMGIMFFTGTPVLADEFDDPWLDDGFGDPVVADVSESVPSDNVPSDNVDWGFSGDVYLGFGSNTANITAEEPAFDNTDGRGLHGVFGMKFNNYIAFEIAIGGYDFRTTEPAQAIAYPPDDAHYGYFDFNLKFNFLDINKWWVSPWFARTWADHQIGLSNYQYSLTGICTSNTFGVDVRITKRWTLRLSKNNCTINATEYLFGDNASTFESTAKAIDLVYTFGIDD